jgi:hypothetical protein
VVLALQVVPAVAVPAHLRLGQQRVARELPVKVIMAVPDKTAPWTLKPKSVVAVVALLLLVYRLQVLPAVMVARVQQTQLLALR